MNLDLRQQAFYSQADNKFSRLKENGLEILDLI